MMRKQYVIVSISVSIILTLLVVPLHAGTVEKPEAKQQDPLDPLPLVVAVWDTGVDVTVLKDNLFVNLREIPGNNRDDDNNGYVDDVHGIAYNRVYEPARSLLDQLPDGPGDIQEYKKYLRGFSDLQCGIYSPAAQEFQKKIFSSKGEDVRALLDGMSRYMVYLHGTFVSGIILKDNPAVRLLTARFTQVLEDPDKPTIENETTAARMDADIVGYFKQHNVKIVNVSWSRSLDSVVALLEMHDKEERQTPEERKKLARKIFDIGAISLKKAMAEAPGILFVVVSGFLTENIMPCEFDLPNVIRVGAVSDSSEVRMFTGYNHVDIYADGEGVSSIVPGGDTLSLSGRSWAAAVVTNLAAKILTLKPNLTPTQLKKIILDGADMKNISSSKTAKVLNADKTLELLK